MTSTAMPGATQPVHPPYPWLAAALGTLDDWRAQGRLPHALLLHGPAGWGKRQLAATWAARLLALPPPAEGEVPVHPDLRWVGLDEEHDSRQIRIDQVRELNDFMRSTSVGGLKFCVVADAERMNTAAANALLKTLEEPPGSAHLVLLSERPWALPATIRSRCSACRVQPDAAAAAAWVAALPAASRPDAETLWLAGGAPLVARALHGGDAPKVLDALRVLFAARREAAALADLVKRANACPLPLLLDAWMRALHALRLRASGVDVRAPAWAIDVDGHGARAERMVEALQWAKRVLLGTANPNATLLLEGLLLQWRSV